MIVVIDNFLNKNEIDIIMNLWVENPEFSETAIHFYFTDLFPIKHKLNIKHGLFSSNFFKKIRLQKYNESFNQMETYHGHVNKENIIIFLNDDFDGGILEFECGIFIKPKKGNLVYFNKNEHHRVSNCIGDRYTFTALGDENIFYKLQELNTKSIL